MLAEIVQHSTAEISQEMRRTFDPPSVGGRPLSDSSPRVGAVEAWIDLRRKADGPTRRKIDGAIQQTLTDALRDASVHPEAVCALLRLFRLASVEKRMLSDTVRRGVLAAVESARYKDVKTSYGDAHAELLACVEALRLAPTFEFWLMQMRDPQYVTNAVSGCLGSGNEQWVLNGLIQAAKLRDRSLALALMRLFRQFQGRENLVWARFAEARRNGAWSEDDYDRVSRAMAQIGQSCPADLVLALEAAVVFLQMQLREKDRLLKAAQAKAQHPIRAERSAKSLGESALEKQLPTRRQSEARDLHGESPQGQPRGLDPEETQKTPSFGTGPWTNIGGHNRRSSAEHSQELDAVEKRKL